MEQSTVLKTFLDYVQISSESRSEKTFAKRVENDLRSLGPVSYTHLDVYKRQV